MRIKKTGTNKTEMHFGSNLVVLFSYDTLVACIARDAQQKLHFISVDDTTKSSRKHVKSFKLRHLHDDFHDHRVPGDDLIKAMDQSIGGGATSSQICSAVGLF